MATVTLSGAITVLLGLRVTGVAERRLDDIALTMGALITVLAAAEAFFTHRGLWILRTVTVHRLETLRRRVEYYRSGLGESDPTGAAVDGHFAELDRILAQDEVAWQQLRAPSLGPLHPDVDREGTAA
jgi:hypothetical protein